MAARKPVSMSVGSNFVDPTLAKVHALENDQVNLSAMVDDGIPVELYFPITLTDLDTPADLVTDFVLPFKGRIESYQFVTEVAATSGGTADADIELQLGATTVAGSESTGLTQTDFDTVGEIKAGGTITGDNTFDADDTLSVVCTESAVNFTAGRVGLHIHCVRLP